MSMHRFATPLLTAALLLAAGSSPARAQAVPEALDARWLAFVGCWEPVGVEAEAGLLCIRPSGQGVELENVSAGRVTSTEVLVADGQARDVSAEGCEGTESVSFSSDGRRAFTRSDFVCAGDAERSGTGVMSVVSAGEWVDVRSLAMGDEPVAWVQRYRLVGADRLAEEGIADPAAGLEAAVRGARRAAATALRVDDVEEAVTMIDAEAVEAWVAAHGDEFQLDADELVRLDEAGVPADVIDVMVAVSYPDRFVVEPGAAPDVARTAAADRGYAYPRYRGFRSFLWDPFYSRYHGYYYSPFGYSPFGYFGSGFGYYGYRPTRIVVVRRQPELGGRFVKGEGYRPGSSGGSSGRVARPRGDAGGGASARSAPSRSPSSRPASSPPPRRAKRRGG